MSIWLQAVPISDPIERRQAPLVQIVLLLLLGTCALALPTNLEAAGGRNGQVLAVASTLLIMACMASAFVILRRGSFRAAVLLTTVGLLVGIGLHGIPLGVRGGSLLLCAFMVPIIVSGFLVGRRGLLLSVPFNIIIVAGLAILEQEQPSLVGFGAGQGTSLEITLILYCLIVSLLGLFIDQFGTSLRRALHESLARERELAGIRASLEAQTIELSRAKESLEHELAARKQMETALHHERDLLHALMDNIPDLIYFKDADSRFTRINHATAQLLGLSDPVAAVGKTDFDFFTNGLAQGFYDQEQRIVVSGKPLIDRLELNPTVDGRPRWLSATKVPIKDESGQVIGIVAISRDMTARQEIDRLKSEFIATVSHELRTPLTSVIGALGLLTSGVVGELSHQADMLLNIAYQNSERLRRLIDDILDIERIESGKLSFQIAPMELAPVVEKAVEANRSYGEQYQVTFVLTQTVPHAIVQADSNRLIQVLTNLLSNAAKFSPANSTVEVAVTRHEQTLRVSVIDQGPGIPDEFRSRIFGKFAQANGSDAHHHRGAGLGLSIAKGIVERLGGQIGFSSSAGAGSSFYFELPLWQPSEPA